MTNRWPVGAAVELGVLKVVSLNVYKETQKSVCVIVSVFFVGCVSLFIDHCILSYVLFFTFLLVVFQLEELNHIPFSDLQQLASVMFDLDTTL